MGGAVMWIEADTREECEAKIEEKILEAKSMGLEDIRMRSSPILVDEKWVAEVWIHS